MDKKQKKRLKRKAKTKKQKQASDEAKQRMHKLPKTCSTCSIEFPKTREAHMSWKVVVRAKNEMVRLFCPECQDKVNQLVGEEGEV